MEYRAVAGGTVIKVKVVPNSSQSRVAGWQGGFLKVKVAAQPEKGRANKELVNLISEFFGIEKNKIKIIKGLRNTIKDVFVSLPLGDILPKDK